ncbi:MAG: CPBP family intramembrane metalloprotease [Kiritimatiellia bacterium]|jgi:hypothetical protein|nr:CPBP family intramembrane metalloprotease [Kiritimatiellia bacterium]MDP6848089.1 CPBP family intramembrane metalloprotease [Kiritimatiellia bacterium]
MGFRIDVKSIGQHRHWIVTGVGVAAFSLLFLRMSSFFWIEISVLVVLLCSLAFAADFQMMRRVVRLKRWPSGFCSACLGLVYAAILYGVCAFFFALIRFLFPFATTEISNVYKLRVHADPLVTIVLLTVLIAPGEELFWRGYVQSAMERRFGTKGMIPAIAAYSLAHVASGNLMLVTAAAACGLFWAFLYWRYRSIRLNIITHTAWTVAVFIVWPLL